MKKLRCWLLAFALLCLCAQTAPRYTLVKIADGFANVTSIVQPPDGSQRLFVTELSGMVRIINKNVVLSVPFLDLTRRTKTTVVGQGLYDIAFDPGFASNGVFYVDYVRINGQPVLERYHVSAADPNQADPQSLKLLLTIPH